MTKHKGLELAKEALKESCNIVLNFYYRIYNNLTLIVFRHDTTEERA